MYLFCHPDLCIYNEAVICTSPSDKPNTSIHVLGMDVGYAVTSATVWTGIARKIHARLAMWGRVRLGFRTRVLVIKTMAYSLVWYLGSLWECPPKIRAVIKAAATYFFWKGRMPQGVMPGDPVSAYRCGTPVGAHWLAADVADGGFGLWDASLQLQALMAQWTHRLVKPAGPNERLWRSPILHWINESLGVTNAADVLLEFGRLSLCKALSIKPGRSIRAIPMNDEESGAARYRSQTKPSPLRRAPGVPATQYILRMC